MYMWRIPIIVTIDRMDGCGIWFSGMVSLPPQGFRPEAKSRGGTLVARAYIKDSTYSTNMQSVYRKNLDLLEQGPRGIGR